MYCALEPTICALVAHPHSRETSFIKGRMLVLADWQGTPSASLVVLK